MGERKVLNKYFPPDFDPKKVPRMKRDPEKQIGVRMMIPFSLQCNTCGEFMYRGKKFNSLKEDCIGEDYLGIRRFRFYIKCVICSQEITFKTDPEKGDYELETGASRNFESWTDKQQTEKKHKEDREEEEKSDNMKQLENRTLDSKIELEIMDALDEIKAVNRRHETVNTEDVLKAAAARRQNTAAGQGGKGTGEVDEDEAVIANIQFGGPKVHRLPDGDDSSSDGAGDSSMAAPPDRPHTKTKIIDRARDSTPSKGKGKKRPTGASGGGSTVVVGGTTHKFQPSRESDGASSSRAKDVEEKEVEKGGGHANSGLDGTGSLLVSAIEAQARREAEKIKAAVEGSAGTKIVVKKSKKHKRRPDKGGGGETGEGANASKKRKKHKSKEKSGGGANANGGLGAAAPAPAEAGGSGGGVGAADAPGLGGLNLLGSYASSSGSDGDGDGDAT